MTGWGAHRATFALRSSQPYAKRLKFLSWKGQTDRGRTRDQARQVCRWRRALSHRQRSNGEELVVSLLEGRQRALAWPWLIQGCVAQERTARTGHGASSRERRPQHARRGH